MEVVSVSRRKVIFCANDGSVIKVSFERGGYTFILPVAYIRKRFLRFSYWSMVIDGDPVREWTFNKARKDDVLRVAYNLASDALDLIKSWGGS